MSLSWRERILVSLEPGAVHAVQLRSGEKRAVPAPWLDALKDILAGWEPADVTIVASNRLVRYVVVPRSSEVSEGDEAEALARHHFARVHGERARQWHVRYAPAGGLASAVDLSLLEGLREFFGQCKRQRLASLQPYLMAAFNRWRARIPREGAWLVLHEAGASCVALYERGAWTGVSVSRGSVPAEALVERERLRMGGAGAPKTLLVSDSRDGYAMALSAR